MASQPYSNSFGNDFRFDANSMLAPPPPLRSDSITGKVANGEKKTITRNRASYSCQNCRKRKIKCDKVHPTCAGCRKTNERCLWSDNARTGFEYRDSNPEETGQSAKRRRADTGSRDSGSERTSPESSGDTPDTSTKGSIEDRLDRLTSLVEKLGKGKLSRGSPEASLPPYGLRTETTDGGRLRRQSVNYSGREMMGSDFLHPVTSKYNQETASSKPRNGDAECYPETSEFDIPTGAAAELSDPMSKMNLGYLSVQEGGRSRYVGSTFWAYISDEIDQLNGLLRNENRYRSASANYGGGEETESSPMDDDSDDSHCHNSFHKAGDHTYNQKTQFRSECSACAHNATDKSILLQAPGSQTSRFLRMDSAQVSGFPTQTQANILFRCWLSGVHGQIPLIYPPLAMEKHELIWKWYNNGREAGLPVPEPSVMPLLYAIWYAGSVSISLKGLRKWFPGTTRAELSAGFHDQIARNLRLVGFPRTPSIASLAAYLMLQMILAKEEEPLTSSLYVSLAIRVAQTLGLHREPTLFNFSAWEVEVRRRMWWQIVQLDCVVAIASGLPPLISDDFFDTKMISEIKDPLLGTKEANEYQAAVEEGTRPRDNPDSATTRDRKSMVAVYYVVARAKYHMTRGLRRILKIHLGTKPMTREDMTEMRMVLSEVEHDLSEIIQRIPTKGIPEMGFAPDSDGKGHSLTGDYDIALAAPPTEDDLRPFIGMTPSSGLNDITIRYHWNTLISYHKWARILLSLTIDKMYCVSYAPFLKNAKSKLWPALRQCALRHCHGYMRKFISLAADPAFQPFQWSWPGMHQPMHAAMIMLVDVYERPNSVEAPRSRAFIDKIFSMSGPDGGIVSGEDGVSVQRPLREGGREAWDMLRRLREKAWQKAGLDPDVLWTEEEQIQVGVADPVTEAEKIVRSLREDTFHEGGGKVTDTGPTVLSLFNEAVAPMNFKTPRPSQNLGESDRPKAIQRLSSMQQKTPFKSSAKAAPKAETPISGNVKNNALTSSSSMADLSAFAAPCVPVPSMAPPTTSYFNPPTAASSVSAGDTGAWSQTTAAPTPNAGQPGQSSQPHTQSQYLSQTQAPGNPRVDTHNAPSPTSAYMSMAPPAGPEEHFDWAQWDAVFGQHPGFEDTMDAMDVDWGNEISSAVEADGDQSAVEAHLHRDTREGPGWGEDMVQ